jgi:hypothetical protein
VNGLWMSQIGRNLTDSVDGLLKGKRYLIHDRDPLFTAEFLNILAETGVASVRIPPRSPNLAAATQLLRAQAKGKKKEFSSESTSHVESSRWPIFRTSSRPELPTITCYGLFPRTLAFWV